MSAVPVIRYREDAKDLERKSLMQAKVSVLIASPQPSAASREALLEAGQRDDASLLKPQVRITHRSETRLVLDDDDGEDHQKQREHLPHRHNHHHQNQQHQKDHDLQSQSSSSSSLHQAGAFPSLFIPSSQPSADTPPSNDNAHMATIRTTLDSDAFFSPVLPTVVRTRTAVVSTSTRAVPLLNPLPPPPLPPLPSPAPGSTTSKIRLTVDAQPKKDVATINKKNNNNKKRLFSKSHFDDWPDTQSRRGPKPSGVTPAAAVPPFKPTKPTTQRKPVESSSSGRPVSQIFSQSVKKPVSPQDAQEDPVEHDTSSLTPDRRPQGISTGSSDRGHHHFYRAPANESGGLLGLLQQSRNRARQCLTDLALQGEGESHEIMRATIFGPARFVERVDSFLHFVIFLCGRSKNNSPGGKQQNKQRRDELHFAVAARIQQEDGGFANLTLLIPCVYDTELKPAMNLKNLGHIGFCSDPSKFLIGDELSVCHPFYFPTADVVMCSGLVTKSQRTQQEEDGGE